MAVTSFKDVAWANEAITTDKLNVMSANTRYLFERAPKLLFTAYGAKRDTGVRIASGVATCAATTANSRQVNIPFGSFFSVGCKPVITTGIHSVGQGGLVLVHSGLSGSQYQPDNRGVRVTVSARELNSKYNHILKTSYIHWMAMGY